MIYVQLCEMEKKYVGVQQVHIQKYVGGNRRIIRR